MTDDCYGRNPYFIGINSAIISRRIRLYTNYRRNPYFIGINSAIAYRPPQHLMRRGRNPYFIGINSAILLVNWCHPRHQPSQSLFYWN